MQTHFDIVRQAVVERKTEKVMADTQSPLVYSDATRSRYDSRVEEAIAAAGLAPFHFERGVDGVPEPWRAYFLDCDACRQIAQKLGEWFDLKPNNKIPAMLSACGGLVLVTWLPQFRGGNPDTESTVPREKQLEIDDEHLAATAAFVQSLLLLLTADGLGTYWSSGGQLGSKELFARLGIAPSEKLLAAVFIEYPDGAGQTTERAAGKNRVLRSEFERWSRKIDPSVLA